MYEFLASKRDELIFDCKHKLAERIRRQATPAQLEIGVPVFVDQLTRTLQSEEIRARETRLEIPGSCGGKHVLSEMVCAAGTNGTVLLELGYTIDQVVHDYGDLYQAITSLALEHGSPFSVHELRTLNRCLVTTIADAVTRFSASRDEQKAEQTEERIGSLMHELRNAVGTATLAFQAMEQGNLPFSGATGGTLKRSMEALTRLVDHALTDVRQGYSQANAQRFSVAAFVEDARREGELNIRGRHCALEVGEVDPELYVSGNRNLLLAAVANLLQNAYKFTHAHTTISLRAYADGDRVLFEVEDHCGGLPISEAEAMFAPFAQHGTDRSGLGLGLLIARKSVEADSGLLSVRSLPGKGCVFTISLPWRGAPRTSSDRRRVPRG